MRRKNHLTLWVCLVVFIGCSREHTAVKNEVTNGSAVADDPTLLNFNPSLIIVPSEIRAAMGAFRHLDFDGMQSFTAPPRMVWTGKWAGTFGHGIRKLERRKGFGHDTQVISSREQWDAVIGKISERNHYQESRTMLQSIPIDFSHEAIFLLQHKEGTPGPNVRWGIPTLSASSSTRGRELKLRIHVKHKPFGQMVPQADVDYAFPVVVDLSKVDAVSLTIIETGSVKAGQREIYVAYLNEANWAQVAIEREDQLQERWWREVLRRGRTEQWMDRQVSKLRHW